MPRPFPKELQIAHRLVEWFMTERFNLNPFFEHSDGTRGSVHFELCDPSELYRLAAYGGFPHRYPHYRFGLDYDEFIKGDDYGLSKIYEMVINSDPIYAYLLFGNSMTDQMLVMCHVYGHADFFVNNFCFRKTNRRSVEMMANHAMRIQKYVEQHGEEVVEQFLDRCLAIDNLIDPYEKDQSPDPRTSSFLLKTSSDDDGASDQWSGRFSVKHDYLDSFINPPQEIKAQEERNKLSRAQEDAEERKVVFPPRPVRDVMKFIADHAPLLDWQRDVLMMLREEAYYFSPQKRTKIMNEGWASYWHSKGMTGLISSDAVVDYADHNSGTLAVSSHRINPYFLGREMFRNIEWRWNTHRHGKIFYECADQAVLEYWDQFVAFYTILEASNRGECGLHQKWNEFLCFWRAIKELPLACVVYEDQERLLWWWDYYCHIDQKMRDNTRAIDDCMRQINECVLYRAMNSPSIDRDEVELKKEFLADHLLPRLRGLRSFLTDLLNIRNNFIAGSLLPEDFVIPDSFFEHAQLFSGQSLVIADGHRKIFEVRELYEDVTFIDAFLTPDVALRTQLFTFDRDQENPDFYTITSREFNEIKKKLCASIANGYEPCIEIVDANFDNAGEMLLHHYFEGIELKYEPDAEATLESLFALWDRPVHLDTVFTDEENNVVPTRLSYDGEDHLSNEIDDDDAGDPFAAGVYP